jgi:hypothetical protein
MPRHQTSRQIGDPTAPSEKLDILRKYAQISNRVQEYGSAALSSLEAILMIISSCFLYTSLIDGYGNTASLFLITSQCISLVPNALDLYELIGFLKKNPDRFTEFTVVSHLIVVASYIIGTLLLICGAVFTLSYVAAFYAAPWVFLAGRCDGRWLVCSFVRWFVWSVCLFVCLFVCFFACIVWLVVACLRLVCSSCWAQCLAPLTRSSRPTSSSYSSELSLASVCPLSTFFIIYIEISTFF